MRYLPHTTGDIERMLAVVGAESLDDLFSTIPPEARLGRPLDLPEPLEEQSLNRHMDALAGMNAPELDVKSFIGAGCYEHFIPHAVTSVMSRSEFLTAYTPYQPELSQGTLQGIFEYQTLICRLLGMEVSNGSLYDGASVLAEALLMAIRVTGRTRVMLSTTIHPLYRRVAETYLGQSGYTVESIGGDGDGGTGFATVSVPGDVAAIAVQSPNFYGCIEDIGEASRIAHEAGALSVAVFTEPLAYGLLAIPGSLGADIVCGEGRSFGLPPSFGGSSLGVFCARKAHVRQMPGRIIGQTVDRDGRRGFVITLATREQHIRRERATSNICSNQSLCALTAAAYLSTLGKTGIRALARTNYDRTEYLKTRLRDIGVRIRFKRPTFNEFVAEFPPGFEDADADFAGRGYLPGLALGQFAPELEHCRLICVTETATREDLDGFIGEVESWIRK